MSSATRASLPRIACAPVATPRAGLGAPSPARRSRRHLPAKNGGPDGGQEKEKQQPSFWENLEDAAPILLPLSGAVTVAGSVLTLVVQGKIDTSIKGAIKEFQDPINAKLLASDARLSESLKASQDALAASAKTSQDALATSQAALVASAQTYQYALVAVVAALAVVVAVAVVLAVSKGSKDSTDGKGRR